MILAESDLFFENLDLNEGTLICKDGMKIPSSKIVFIPNQDQNEPEIYRIRGLVTSKKQYWFSYRVINETKFKCIRVQI